MTSVRFRDYLKIHAVIPISGRRSDSSSNMKKAKNLKKRIRRLEARMQKGAKKLARLKRKLEAAETVPAAESTNKAAAPAVKPAAVKEPRVAKKVKRKLNLTPERRAQLAAAMRARWAAKRAAAATNTQKISSGPDPSSGDASQPL